MTRSFSILTFMALVSLAWPVRRLWLAQRRSALRSTCVWIGVAVGAWACVAGISVLEPEPGAWRGLALLRLVSTTLGLMPLVAVFGARRPGEAAWNLVVVTLWAVLTLPVFEQWVLGRQLETDRIGIDGPRMTICAVIAIVGVVNYLPTRLGLSALLVGVGLAAQFAAIGPWRIGSATAVSLVCGVSGMLTSAAGWLAHKLARTPASRDLDGAWRQLRDGWGVVWSVRLLNRWNATAERHGWNLRLSWSGFAPLDADNRPTDDERQAASDQFAVLLRRFFDPEEFMQATAARAPSRSPTI